MTDDGRDKATRKAQRQTDLARQVDVAAGRRVLLDFIAWLDTPASLAGDMAPNVKAWARLFWKQRTGTDLHTADNAIAKPERPEPRRTMTVEVEHKPEPRRTMTVEVEHKPEPRRTMTVEVER